jgi:hypothetical protein
MAGSTQIQTEMCLVDGVVTCTHCNMPTKPTRESVKLLLLMIRV